ncbi:MAG: hypothetical protein BZY80_06630 [SAR202 cluster bacterium Io17-Chloro-G2]|nr:MAG: hypothetical protein BZY80_06630 [SAR202 cluster bacterium Io17-Chloro-G2]
MPDILVLEGLTDATFFQEVISRWYFRDDERLYSQVSGRRNMPAGVRGFTSQGTQREIEFRYHRIPSAEATGGKDQFPAIISALLDEGIWDFSVARDLDLNSREQVLSSIEDIVYSHSRTTGQGNLDVSGQITAKDGTISVLPMGKGNSATLESLGVMSHSMEDYLIELMLHDPSLRRSAPDLNELLLEILPSIRMHDGPFDSSKELFQLIKPIVQHGFSDTGVVHKLIRDADENILRAVLAPLLADMEPAFGLGTGPEVRRR